MYQWQMGCFQHSKLVSQFVQPPAMNFSSGITNIEEKELVGSIPDKFFSFLNLITLSLKISPPLGQKPHVWDSVGAA